jgi:sporulation protein YlmC with PRC-barrel domain
MAKRLPKSLKASEMIDDAVRNRQGEDLGKITEFMIDLEHGCIAYAVLSFGGWLGMGDKLFAVPWSALSLDPEVKEFVLDVAREDLRDAPGFDKDNWPDMSDVAWGASIHEYYGASPYWETREPRRRW